RPFGDSDILAVARFGARLIKSTGHRHAGFAPPVAEVLYCSAGRAYRVSLTPNPRRPCAPDPPRPWKTLSERCDEPPPSRHFAPGLSLARSWHGPRRYCDPDAGDR